MKPINKLDRPTKLSSITATLFLAACGSDDQSIGIDDRTIEDTSNYVAIDATQGPAYLNLESGHTITNTGNWHMSYQKYVGFSVNGGISGSGSVSACIAHSSADLYDNEGAPVQSEFESLTRANTLPAFTAVNSTSCAESDFKTDSIKTAIELSDWLAADYSQGAPIYSASSENSNGWIIQSATKNDADNFEYGRVKVSNVEYESGVKRSITLSFESWDANAQAFSSPVNSPELVFTDNRIYWDMESNSIATSSDNWELSIVVNGYSWDLQVNGGVSGQGSAGVATLLVDSAVDVTNPAPGTTGDVYQYASDSAESILSGPGNYGTLQYAVAGGHLMWPTFTTYLFKDEERFYKAQIVSNYGEDGTLSSGNLYVRYEEVTE